MLTKPSPPRGGIAHDQLRYLGGHYQSGWHTPASSRLGYAAGQSSNGSPRVITAPVGAGDVRGAGEAARDAGDVVRGADGGAPWCPCGAGSAMPAARATTSPSTTNTSKRANRPSSSHSTRRASVNHAGALGAPSGCQPRTG